MRRVCQISVSWDADNPEERKLTQILLIISKINLRPSAYSASSASGNINLTHLLRDNYFLSFNKSRISVSNCISAGGGAGAAGAVLAQRRDPRLDDGGLHRQAQIVIGAQHDAPCAFHGHGDVLTRFQGVEIRVEPHIADLILDKGLVTLGKQIHHFASCSRFLASSSSSSR